MTTKRAKYATSLVLVLLAFFLGLGESRAIDGPNPAVNYNFPNFANSPLPTVVGGVVTPNTGIRKFVDSLSVPGTYAAPGANGIGQFIPIATPQTPPNVNGVPPTWAATDDYYEIALVEYVEQMHSDLPPVVGAKIGGTGGTKLRGYVQEANGVPMGDPHYLGPLIIATKDKPVRIKFTNRLPIGVPAGNLFIPTDVTMMGAGPYEIDVDPLNPQPGATITGNFTQNRATLHLHGGNTPWISDGTPHQWTVPAGEFANTTYPKGMSVQNVPDMELPANGSLTFYYTNQQSGRLMFYHDHAYGITRLNVYAGEAAGYLLTDTAERALTNGGTVGIPNMPEVPLVIQDRTFVPDPLTQLATSDPSWDTANWGGMGNFWFPHVYMPNQWPNNPDNTGVNPLGRWDYGPWFWPIFPAPGAIPALSSVPEAFMDTPVVNGTVYPYYNVPAGPVRFRILNAANDRYWNLQLYQTSNILSGITVTAPGATYTAAPIVTITNAAGDTTGKGATALATVDLTPASPTLGQVTGIRLVTVGSGYTAAPTVTITPAPGDLTGVGATATATLYTGLTEVGMIPYVPPQASWPAGWGTPDSREGGVPDPALRGPAIVQIGTEGGILPYPAVVKNIPIDYDYNRRSVTVLNVLEHGLFLGPAERADVIIDFTPYAGKTIILYNDAPAPVPGFDPRNDYYTAAPDWTANGGAPSTLAGYGPNTRTIMAFNVAGVAGATPPNDYYNPNILTALQTALPAAFALTQDRPIVAESAYNAAFGTAWTDQYARIYTGSSLQPTFNFTDGNSLPQSYTPGSKAIQELFDNYGRMNSTLGVELPATSALIQTTIPLGYIDPPTETFNDGETQIWKITHNGVDTHAVHFHLFNAQLINRVGWDGTIKPPDPNEQGWKDTIRMNPLEDIIVAVKAKSQTGLPFTLPDSVRPMDVTMPIGSSSNFTQVDPATGNPATVVNAMYNYHWEYVWHCHLLGHEENDMMRPMVLVVGQAGPTAGVAPTTLTFASQAINTTSAAQTVTLSNTGTGALTINSITITGANPADFARTTTCGTSLPAPTAPATSTTCTISVTFKPTVSGARAGNITISTNDTVHPTLTVAMTGTGASPTAGVAPTTLTFTNQQVGTTSAAQTATLSNTGTAPLTITGITIGGTNAGDFARTTTCGATLAAGATCTISVTFAPTAAGARTASVAIASNDPVNPTLSVALTGTGTAPTAGVAPTTLTFTNQQVGTTSAAQTATLSNTGTAPLTITGITIGGTNAGDFARTTTCGATLAAGATCTISVTFAPTAAGARTASVAIATNAPVNPTLSVALTGTGTAPTAGVAPTTLTFAGQMVNTTSAAQSVTLSNNGTAALTISSITIAGTNANNFARTTTCGATLAAGATCTISVTFTPTAAGARTASVAIATNAPANPTLSVALTGTGTAPIAGVSPLSLTFGNQAIGVTSAGQMVTLSNTGTANLTVNSITITGANAGDFAELNGCGTLLVAGGTCSAFVTFRPTAGGARAASLTFSTNDAAHPTLTVGLSGTGTGARVTPTSLAFGNQALNTNSATQSVTLTNLGTTSLTGIAISLTGANASSFRIASNNCRATLAAGATCTIGIRFRPTAVGAMAAALSITDSDPTSPQTVQLSGTGTGPALGLSPTSVAFGNWAVAGGATAPRTVTVSNTGTAPLIITGITISGGNATQFARTNVNCPIRGAGLAAGASCTVNVTFNPSTVGNKTSSLRVAVSAPATTQSVPLTGTGQ